MQLLGAHVIVDGYHTCEYEFAKTVVDSDVRLSPSTKDYEWLGTGIYFWIDSIHRAKQWKGTRTKLKSPAILKAKIELGLCLDLRSPDCIAELQHAYKTIAAICANAGHPIPRNQKTVDGVAMYRNLDAVVIDTVHMYRRQCSLPRYDTVLGLFEEGEIAYPGSAIRTQSHIQCAVLDHHKSIREIELVWHQDS